MPGLLSSIQGYFKGSYSGRYMAHLLAELFKQDAHAFERVIKSCGSSYSHSPTHKAIANTWLIPGLPVVRYADLAIVNAEGKALLLIEIKDRDISNPKNASQIADYINYLRRAEKLGTELIYLSRSIPPARDDRVLRARGYKSKIHKVLFRDLYKPLSSGGHFCKMLREYLEDIEVVYFEKLPDLKSLHHVASRALGIGGRNVPDRAVPELLRIVFANLASVGAWLQASNPHFKQSMRRHLYAEPWHDVTTLAQDLKDKKREKALRKSSDLAGYCIGGEVDFYASGHLTRGSAKVYVEFGYWCHVEQKKSDMPFTYRSGIYAFLQWSPWKESSSHEGSMTLKKFATEEVFQNELRAFFKEGKAIIKKSKDCPDGVKRLITEIVVP